MRRWQAIPMAAFVALAVGAVLFVQPQKQVSAGPILFSLSLDCIPGGGIDSAPPNCVFASAAPVSVDVIFRNTSGAPARVSAFQFDIISTPQVILNPAVPGSCNILGTNCNPDFNEGAVVGSFNCGAPVPEFDKDASALTADSFLSCSNGAGDGPVVADSGSIVLATVSYTTSDGVGNLSIANFSIYDDTLSELGSCNAPIINVIPCSGATVQIGASASTSTPIPTATNTVVPTATCVGAACPTATSLAFKTVTPTGTIVPAGSGTQAPAATVPPASNPPATGDGQQPGGSTGAGGQRPIRLPDTGATGGGGGSGGLNVTLMLLIAAVFGTAAGGGWFVVASRNAASRRED